MLLVVVTIDKSISLLCRVGSDVFHDFSTLQLASCAAAAPVVE